MPLLWKVPPQKYIFCGSYFGFTIALDVQQNLILSYRLLKHKLQRILFLEFIALSCSPEVLFVKFPLILANFVGLFFGYIRFHAGQYHRPRKYRLVVHLVSCT